MFSSEHYIVGAIGILLSMIFVAIINMVSTAREMPNMASDRADVREKGAGESLQDRGPGRTHLREVTPFATGSTGFPPDGNRDD